MVIAGQEEEQMLSHESFALPDSLLWARPLIHILLGREKGRAEVSLESLRVSFAFSSK